MSREELQTLFNWRQSQATTLATGCFSLAGLILSPLLAAVFDASAQVEVWQTVLFLVGTAGAAFAGCAFHVVTARIQQDFTLAIGGGTYPAIQSGGVMGHIRRWLHPRLPAAAAQRTSTGETDADETSEETLKW